MHYIIGMNKLDHDARARILHLLCEGSSIRAVTRLTGASKNTVSKLMVDAGKAAPDGAGDTWTWTAIDADSGSLRISCGLWTNGKQCKNLPKSWRL